MAAANMQLQQQLANAQQPVEVEDTEEVVITDTNIARAQVVKDLLVKKYGISADRLKVAAGGGVDKFGQPILNRVVLVESAQ